MAVKIPQYQDRLTPSGLGPQPQARAVPVSDAMGQALQQLGNAGQQFAGVEMNFLKQKEEADAITDAGKKLSDANVEWNKWLDEKQRTAPAGAPNFYEDVDREYNAWRDKTLGTIVEPKARQYAERTLNNQRDNVLGRALQFQAKAGVDKRMNDLEDTTRNYEATVGADLRQYRVAREAVLGVIANDPTLDANTKADVARKVTDRLTIAAVNGELQRNPTGTRDALLARLGKTTLTPDEEAQVRSTGVTLPQSAPVAAPQGGGAGIEISDKLPAGMRNRNPGNIKFVGQKDAVGPSKNTDQGDPQAVYASDEQGFAALYKLALRKYDGGKNTIEKLIAGQGGWTPGNMSAAGNIAKSMGVGVDQQINLRDPATLKKFARALVIQEHGQASKMYSDALISGVADDVLAGKSVKAMAYAPDPINQAVDEGRAVVRANQPGQPLQMQVATIDADVENLISNLPQQQVISMLHSAQTEVNRQQSVYQSSLKTTETDHMAAFGNGDAVARPLTEGEYQKAYGPVEGAQRYAEYSRSQQLGAEINAVRTMTVEQQQAVLASHAAAPGSPGYALELQRKQVLEQAIDRVNQARAADPMTFAMQSRIGNVKPIDWNKTDEVQAELINRVGVASTMNQNYGAPLTLLTKQEAANLAAGMNNMSAPEKLRYLGLIRASVKDQAAYRSIVQQIAPDSVVTAVAGMIVTKDSQVTVSRMFGADDTYAPQQVAQLMLEGEAILNPTKAAAGQDGRGGKYPLPKESDFLTEFNNQVGNAFAGNPAAASAAMQSVKAYYVGKSAREGDLSDVMNSKRMQEAISAVTGGVTDINGSNVIRPWGMPEDIFKDRAKVAFEGTIKSKGMIASYGGVTLQNYGDGSYLVRSGTDFLRGPDGAPIVIDVVSAAAPAPAASQTLPTTPGKTKEPGTPKLKTR